MIEDPGARERAALQSYERYLQAYALSHDFFPGFNAATMSVLAGRTREGRELAREVLDRCRKRGPDAPENHWLCATPGELSVLLGERGEALRWYARAYEMAGRRYGDLASMRRRLKLLSTGLPLAAEALSALRMPRVAFFAGHMLDRPERPLERFPARLVPAAEREIGRAHRAGHGARQRLCERADRGAVVCRRQPGFRMRLPRADGAGQGLRPRRALSPAARARTSSS